MQLGNGVHSGKQNRAVLQTISTDIVTVMKDRQRGVS